MTVEKGLVGLMSRCYWSITKIPSTLKECRALHRWKFILAIVYRFPSAPPNQLPGNKPNLENQFTILLKVVFYSLYFSWKNEIKKVCSTVHKQSTMKHYIWRACNWETFLSVMCTWLTDQWNLLVQLPMQCPTFKKSIFAKRLFKVIPYFICLLCILA